MLNCVWAEGGFEAGIGGGDPSGRGYLEISPEPLSLEPALGLVNAMSRRVHTDHLEAQRRNPSPVRSPNPDRAGCGQTESPRHPAHTGCGLRQDQLACLPDAGTSAGITRPYGTREVRRSHRLAVQSLPPGTKRGQPRSGALRSMSRLGPKAARQYPKSLLPRVLGETNGLPFVGVIAAHWTSPRLAFQQVSPGSAPTSPEIPIFFLPRPEAERPCLARTNDTRGIGRRTLR